MNPLGGPSSTDRASRPRGQSIRSQAGDLDESKLLHDGSRDTGAPRAHDGSDDSFSDEDLHDDEETGLTTKDRRRKKQKKRRNTLLDQRIARESVTAEEKREADRNVLKQSLINVTLIGLWYVFSLSISIVSSVLHAAPSTMKTPTYRWHDSTTSGCLTPAN
jgi:solute carrier family 35 protein C2